MSGRWTIVATYSTVIEVRMKLWKPKIEGQWQYRKRVLPIFDLITALERPSSTFCPFTLKTSTLHEEQLDQENGGNMVE